MVNLERKKIVAPATHSFTSAVVLNGHRPMARRFERVRESRNGHTGWDPGPSAHGPNQLGARPRKSILGPGRLAGGGEGQGLEAENSFLLPRLSSLQNY